MDNIRYYDNNAALYVERTYDADMTHLYHAFQKYLPSGKILDLGCGPGRDTLYFLEAGYDVTGMDGSQAMVDHCRNELHLNVVHATFDSYQPKECFDGIWACASLVHVPHQELTRIILRYLSFLRIGGIFFMSFKDRSEDYEAFGRTFTCFTPDSLRNYMQTIDDIEILEYDETIDVRDYQEDERWISVFFKKCE